MLKLTTATLCCLASSEMSLFCSAISPTKAFAALFSASILDVFPLMVLVIDEDVSNTSTMSSGVVVVDMRFDVEESAVSDVMNSEPSFFEIVISLSVSLGL